MTTELQTPDADQLWQQASDLLDRQRIGQARDVLAQALKIEPEHAGLLYESARADYLVDNYGQARATLQHLLRQDPADASARLLLFWIEMEDGELVEAEGLILGLLREAPQHPHYYACYARLMLLGLDFKKADALAGEALRLAPNDTECLRVRALCDLVNGRTGRKNKALLQLIVDDPQDRYTLRLLVHALSEAGRGGDAYRLARELLRAQPDDVHLLSLVKALAAENHWSMKPLWPVRRWGWRASVGLWVVAIIVSRLLETWWPAASSVFLVFWLSYVVYSWVWPPLLQRWLAWRA